MGNTEVKTPRAGGRSFSDPDVHLGDSTPVQTKKQRDENEGFLSFLFGTGKNANGQVLVDPVKTGNNALNGKAPYPRGRATQPKNIPAHVKGTASITRTYSSQAVPGKAKPKGMMMSNSTGGRPKSGTVDATPGWSTLLAEYAMANESHQKPPSPTSAGIPRKRSESSMSPPTNRKYKVQARSLKAIQQRRDWIKNKNNLEKLQSTEPTDVDSVQNVKEIEQEIKKELDDGELINFAEGAHLNPQLLKRDSIDNDRNSGTSADPHSSHHHPAASLTQSESSKTALYQQLFHSHHAPRLIKSTQQREHKIALILSRGVLLPASSHSGVIDQQQAVHNSYYYFLNKMKFPSLKYMCEEVLAKSVDMNNCLELYEFSLVYGLRVLEIQCLAIIKNHFSAIQISATFREQIKELQETQYIHYIHHYFLQRRQKIQQQHPELTATHDNNHNHQSNHTFVHLDPDVESDHRAFVLYHLESATGAQMADVQRFLVDLFISPFNICRYLTHSITLELVQATMYLLKLIDESFAFVTKTEDYLLTDLQVKLLIEDYKHRSLQEYFKKYKERVNFSV
jgi:hypothetical protein